MASAEACHRGQYVKLRKVEKDGDAPAGTEDIRPGELNQSVRVPELEDRDADFADSCFRRASSHRPTNPGVPGSSGWTGLLCPYVLFGRNTQAVTGVPWTIPCTCHGVCLEGGIALAILTAAFHGVTTPAVSCLIGEGVLCGWMLCAAYTSFPRGELQKKYHLMVPNISVLQ
ncbi:Cell number regulator 6 [Dichanthelium oligosanthes]|uniref:Cell number regulator 6 n=1 Tax=Dichanthelium oligosanthes TaxID=888268 RepID=A0A1E5VEJ2_9POAL|nr:Cell number regulator 6 [Dichanthelium oligosanthes]